MLAAGEGMKLNAFGRHALLQIQFKCSDSWNDVAIFRIVYSSET